MRVTTPTLLDKVVDFRVSENAEIEHEDFIKIWREIFFQESLYNLYYDHNFFIQTQYLNILLTYYNTSSQVVCIQNVSAPIYWPAYLISYSRKTKYFNGNKALFMWSTYFLILQSRISRTILHYQCWMILMRRFIIRKYI